MDQPRMSALNGSSIGGLGTPATTKRPGVMDLLSQQAELVEIIAKLSVELEDKTAAICVVDMERENGSKEAEIEKNETVRPDNVIRRLNARLNIIVDRLEKISRTLNI